MEGVGEEGGVGVTAKRKVGGEGVMKRPGGRVG